MFHSPVSSLAFCVSKSLQKIVFVLYMYCLKKKPQLSEDLTSDGISSEVLGWDKLKKFKIILRFALFFAVVCQFLFSTHSQRKIGTKTHDTHFDPVNKRVKSKEQNIKLMN